MLVAIVAAAFAGCSKDATSEIENIVPANTVTVKFGATVEETRATLEPNEGETAFAAAWEDGDQIGVYANALYGEDGEFNAQNTLGKCVGNAFETAFKNAPSEVELAEYVAYYPYTVSVGSLTNISFGPNRVQNGNKYNSQYDIMISENVMVDKSNIGKDENGNAIVFQMKRQTAIAYFHFATTDNTIASEKLVSAKLSVTGGNIAAEKLQVAYNETYNTISLGARNDAKKEITITFEGDEATAGDFTSWFNVLPGSFDSMTLELETENYTATVTRNGAVTYEAGKLYKVSATDKLQWKPKTEDYSGTYLIMAQIVNNSHSQNGCYFYLAPNDDNANFQKALSTNIYDLNNDYSNIVEDNNAWVIVKQKDNYLLKTLNPATSGSDRYIKSVNNQNQAKFVAKKEDAELIEITKNDDGTFNFKITQASGDRCFALNKNSGQERFAFYKTGTQSEKLVLIPYVQTPKITTNVTNVTVSPEGKDYEDITYKVSGFETAPTVTVECDGMIVTAAENVDGTIMYTVSANTTGEERNGWIKLSADGVEQKVVVNQESNKLAAPSNIKASGTATEIKASWDKVANATSYEWTLYKGTDKDGEKVVVSENDFTSAENDTTVTLTIAGTFDVGAQYVLYVKSLGDGENYKDSDEAQVEVSFNGGTEPVKEITAKLTLSSSNKFGTSSGSTLKDDNGNIWTVTSDVSIQNTYNSTYKGQQFGTGSTNGTITFSTTINKPIKSISVIAAAGGTKATVEFTINNISCGTNVLSKTSTEYTVNGNGQGAISIVFKQNEKKAVYLGEIKVIYEE